MSPAASEGASPRGLSAGDPVQREQGGIEGVSSWMFGRCGPGRPGISSCWRGRSGSEMSGCGRSRTAATCPGRSSSPLIAAGERSADGDVLRAQEGPFARKSDAIDALAVTPAFLQNPDLPDAPGPEREL